MVRDVVLEITSAMSRSSESDGSPRWEVCFKRDLFGGRYEVGGESFANERCKGKLGNRGEELVVKNEWLHQCERETKGNVLTHSNPLAPGDTCATSPKISTFCACGFPKLSGGDHIQTQSAR